MSALSNDILGYFQALPALSSYTFQWGFWEENKMSASERYFIIKENAGSESNLSLRNPNYTLYVIGREREGMLGQDGLCGEVADQIMQYLIDEPGYERFIVIKSINEPIPAKSTGNRPYYTINIRTTTCGVA